LAQQSGKLQFSAITVAAMSFGTTTIGICGLRHFDSVSIFGRRPVRLNRALFF
jgi:hypothetical protein